MNERIRELALAAGKYADETQPRGSYTRDGMWLYAYNEKFAELLAQEAADVAYNTYWNNPDKVRGEHLKQAIKQHFGVEE